MKRDMDLARRILLELERVSYDGGPVFLRFQDCEPRMLDLHVQILKEAGLIDVADCSGMSDLNVLPTRLTWQGYEFVELVRSETSWQTARETVQKAVGAQPFELLKTTLERMARDAMNGR